MPISTDQDHGVVKVPLRGLAIASGAVALTSLATLVVVASINDVETLSTVALALAVIAFVAQLIVFVVQTSAANQQLLQSRELHAELLRLLGEMGERTRGTHAVVARIDERLLEAALEKTLGRGDADSSDRRAVAAQVAALVNEPSGTNYETFEDQADVIDPQAARETRRMLKTFPSEPTPDAIAQLRALSPMGRRALVEFASDAVDWTGTRIGPGKTLGIVEGAQELVDRGLLVERVRNRKPIWWVLNDEGREVARLLFAEGAPPAWLAETWRELGIASSDLDHHRERTSAP